jgi:hypothetical protein
MFEVPSAMTLKAEDPPPERFKKASLMRTGDPVVVPPFSVKWSLGPTSKVPPLAMDPPAALVKVPPSVNEPVEVTVTGPVLDQLLEVVKAPLSKTAPELLTVPPVIWEVLPASTCMVPALTKVPVSERVAPGESSMVPRFGVLPGAIPAPALVWRVSVWPA